MLRMINQADDWLVSVAEITPTKRGKEKEKNKKNWPDLITNSIWFSTCH